MQFGIISNEKTFKKAMYFREKNNMDGEKLEVTVSASGKDAGRLLKMAEEITDRFFKEAKEELKKGASEEALNKAIERVSKDDVVLNQWLQMGREQRKAADDTASES